MTKSIMKTSRALALAMVVGIASLSSTGCTERSVVTWHEPGVYKGGDDPLLAKQKDSQQIAALQERLVMGQSDR
jgi:hypothetical protein